MSTKEQVLSRLCDKINLLLPQEGSIDLVDGLSCAKFTHSESISCPVIYNPAVIYLINGKKECSIGSTIISYEQGQMFINTLNLPASYKIIGASEQCPHLALKMNIDTKVLAKVMNTINYKFDENYYKGDTPSSFVRMDSSYYDLCILERMLDLRIGDFNDAYPYMLQKRELYYHWLTNSQLAPLIAHYVVKKTISIVKAIDFINHNYAKNILVEELANLCAMSMSNFYKNFKQVTSMSPIQYIRRKRLLEARNMLRSFNYKAIEVSAMVGYSSDQQFSRDYSKFFGITPKKDAVLNSERYV